MHCLKDLPVMHHLDTVTPSLYLCTYWLRSSSPPSALSHIVYSIIVLFHCTVWHQTDKIGVAMQFF